MDVLRITTAGSVDDGKSTMIGRLLYETNSIPDDKLRGIEIASKKRGLDFIDLSLLTDGLMAEREQGITIDVAHIYFSTKLRRYIIADSPGHVEYTRNMITGSSNAQVSIILVDAARTLTDQSFLHLHIAHLLRIEHIIIAINKMDVVEYSESKFQDKKEEIQHYWQKLGAEKELTFIPLCSLNGDNISSKTQNPALNWYMGSSLLDILESIEITQSDTEPMRFQVQQTLRESNNANRCFSGKVKSGNIAVGDKVMIHPGGQKTEITAIHKYKELLSKAKKGESITVKVSDDIDISRGSMFVHIHNTIQPTKTISARMCWLSESAFNPLKSYEIQQGSAKASARIKSFVDILNPKTLQQKSIGTVKLNTIFTANITLSKEMMLDYYTDNKANGHFILIDPQTGATVAIGFNQIPV